MSMTIKDLEAKVADYRSLKAMKEQLEAELAAAQADIISYLDDNGKDSETGVDFTVKVSTCQRKTLDSKRLESDLGDLSEYQKISEYRRLTVK